MSLTNTEQTETKHTETKLSEQDQLSVPKLDTDVSSLSIHTGSSVLHHPFFAADTHHNLVVERRSVNEKEDSVDVKDAQTSKASSVLDILDSSMIGDAVKAIYRDITDPDHGFNIENWTFLSANEIKTRQNVYMDKFLDIATRYNGMGWVIVLAYIPETNNFFFRHDGGSSGWDREANFKRCVADTYIPAKFPMFTALAGDDVKHDASGNDDVPVQKSHEIKDEQYTYHDAMRTISNHWIL